jgi:hypothetical protein
MSVTHTKRKYQPDLKFDLSAYCFLGSRPSEVTRCSRSSRHPGIAAPGREQVATPISRIAVAAKHHYLDKSSNSAAI